MKFQKILNLFLFFAFTACLQGKNDVTQPKDLAISAAQKRFYEEEKSSDLKNFKTFFVEHSDKYEVVFVPNQPPKEMGIPEKFGGSTIYGREVHYLIEKDTYKILRHHYAK